ncbi:MAG TPA: septum formation initiator family protein [Crenalkalicoccus sp.]|nr:septum formation initiator family protein [Crenalkalicoccus sp.]
MAYGTWRQAVARRLREAVLPTLFLALCGYFAWHSVHGEYGEVARARRERELAQAHAILDQAIAERDALERKVAGLRNGEIDRDQLEERARALLNMVGHDEIVVPYEPEKRLY